MSVALRSIVPKLPAKDLAETRDFFINKLNFKQQGELYPDYLMIYRDEIEIHFFLHCDLDIEQNYGMCYIRVENIDLLFEEFSKAFPDLKQPEAKPWGQKEFYLNDINNNALAFGESLINHTA